MWRWLLFLWAGVLILVTGILGLARQQPAQNSSLIAFVSNRAGGIYEIFVTTPKGYPLQRVTHFNTFAWSPMWSPDGEWLAFDAISQEGSSHIFRWRWRTGELDQLTYGTGSNRFPAWSPDGQEVVYVREGYDVYFDLYKVGMDDSLPQALTETPNIQEEFPFWSPDGAVIGYDTYVKDQWDIHRLYLEDNKSLPWVNLTEFDRLPRWSPDGNWLLFTATPDTDWDIHKMDLKTGKIIRLTDTPALEGDGSWSPDGKQIVFSSDRSGVSNLYIMRADGSQVRRLTNTTMMDAFPSWSPPIELPWAWGWNVLISFAGGGISLWQFQKKKRDLLLNNFTPSKTS